MARIAIVVASLSGGGAERVATELGAYWHGVGHEVVLITLDGGAEDFWPVPAGVRRVALGVAGGAADPAGGPHRALARAVGRLRALRGALVEARPHVVIGLMTAVNVQCALATIGLGTRLVLTEHNFPPHAAANRTWARLRRHLYRRADAVLALDDSGAAWLREHTSARHVETIPNSLVWPPPRAVPSVSPTTAFAPGARHLLGVGRLVPQKGFDRLLEAFAAVGEPGRDWHLVILGEGPERDALERRRDRLGLGERASLPGRVGNLGDWFQAADAYALSSRHEGLPGALLEAMGWGVPVLAVDCPTGPADVIRDGIDGLLVQDDDEALRAGLARLLGDAALRARLGAAAPEVLERHGPTRVMSLWDALFERLGVPRVGPQG